MRTEAIQANVEGKGWYLIYSKPRGEDLAMEHLTRQNYLTYLPKLYTTRKKGGKLVGQIEPMFPRYLFISLDTETDNWAPIRSTIGVSSLVRFGNQPAVVSNSLIQLLMDREDEHGLLAPPSRTFESGDKVRIFEGPFKDYEAIFVAKNSNERVLVLLEVLGKESRISVPPNIIAKR